MTTTMPMQPGVQPNQAPQPLERPVVANLRDLLSSAGDYSDPSVDQAALYQHQLEQTAEYVKGFASKEDDEAIKPEEAADLLIEVAHEYCEDTVQTFTQERGQDIPKGSLNRRIEMAKIYAEERAKFRDSVIERITPEPEKTSFGEGLRNKLGTWKDHFPPTAKKTRDDYRHYRGLKRKINESAVGSDERTKALVELDAARGEFRRQFVKTTGIVALAGFAAQTAREKGIDASNIWTSLVVGVTAPSVAVGIEMGRMKRALNKNNTATPAAAPNNSPATTNPDADQKPQDGTARILTKYRFNREKLKANDEVAYNKLATREAALESLIEYVKAKESADGFDPNDPQYVTAQAKIAQRQELLREQYEELNGDYLERKLSRRGKVILGVGAAAVAAGVGLYLANKYGIDLPGGGSGNGNGSRAATELTAPKGVNKEAFAELTPKQQTKFITEYQELTPKQKGSFNAFVEGVQTIEAKNPNATQSQIDTLVTNTLDLAAQRGQFVDQADTAIGQAIRGAQFDANWQAYIESLENAS